MIRGKCPAISRVVASGSPEARRKGLDDRVEISYARFTLADPMPRLCPDAVGSANVNGLPTRNRPSGPHREAIGRSSGNIKHV